jgi:hypothetical protein
MLKKIFAFGFLSAVTAFGLASSPVGAQTLVDLNNTQTSAQIGTGNVDTQNNVQAPTLLDPFGQAGPTIIRGSNQQTSGQAGVGNVNTDNNFQIPTILK